MCAADCCTEVLDIPFAGVWCSLAPNTSKGKATAASLPAERHIHFAVRRVLVTQQAGQLVQLRSCCCSCFAVSTRSRPQLILRYLCLPLISLSCIDITSAQLAHIHACKLMAMLRLGPFRNDVWASPAFDAVARHFASQGTIRDRSRDSLFIGRDRAIMNERQI